MGLNLAIEYYSAQPKMNIYTDLFHPTYEKHQWLLLQFVVLLMMDAKGVRNM